VQHSNAHLRYLEGKYNEVVSELASKEGISREEYKEKNPFALYVQLCDELEAEREAKAIKAKKKANKKSAAKKKG